MPTLTATVHQALRYFFAGAVAALLLFLLETPQPALPSTWLERIRLGLSRLDSPGAVVLLWIVGSLIYGFHRTVIYPLLSRVLWWSVSRRRTLPPPPAGDAGRPWWPWGEVTADELQFETRAVGAGVLKDRDHARFYGWASELHLYYIAIEIALFTGLWPGWPLALCWKIFTLSALVGLGACVWCWDRYHLLIQRHLQEHANG
jgi:hypothetical protein